MMMKTNNLLRLGTNYINLDYVLELSTYDKNVEDSLRGIPNEYQFAVEVTYTNNKTTEYYLTPEEWQVFYAELQYARRKFLESV